MVRRGRVVNPSVGLHRVRVVDYEGSIRTGRVANALNRMILRVSFSGLFNSLVFCHLWSNCSPPDSSSGSGGLQ